MPNAVLERCDKIDQALSLYTSHDFTLLIKPIPKFSPISSVTSELGCPGPLTGGHPGRPLSLLGRDLDLGGTVRLMFCTTPSSDFYSLLQIPRDAPPNDIKTAYHRTLLRLHPDKQSRLRHHDSIPDTPVGSTRSRLVPSPTPEEASVDMALLKEAYRTLSDVGLRAAYDGLLRREEHEFGRSYGPRPAQIVSLEEFSAVEVVTEISSGTGTDSADSAQEWRYGCRCGGTYRIAQDDLENGTHLVGCESCSEVIWVGYEEAVISEDEHEDDSEGECCSVQDRSVLVSLPPD